jgi:hypothetical protein
MGSSIVPTVVAPPERDLVLFGANTLLGKFNEYLGTHKDTYGMVLFDRIPVDHPYRYLQEKFQTGLTFPDGRTRRAWKNNGAGEHLRWCVRVAVEGRLNIV